jgi:hypothetical protein
MPTVSLTANGIIYADGTIESTPFSGTKGIFGFGLISGAVSSSTNVVSTTGVIGSDVATSSGTARTELAAAGYGGNRAIFGYGTNAGRTTFYSTTNLVNNLGTVLSNVTSSGVARYSLAAASYGGDKAIFGFGANTASPQQTATNLVSNVGVVASVVYYPSNTRRSDVAAAGYGGDKAIFGFGFFSGALSSTNLVSNTGVVASDTAGVGTARYGVSAVGYGRDKALFAFGIDGGGFGTKITNKVSNLGVVAADITNSDALPTGYYYASAAGYGGDKGIFSFPTNAQGHNILISNLGNIVSQSINPSGVSGRYYAAGASFSL